MTAPITTLADAVVTVINAATLSLTVVAERVYDPKFQADVAGLQVKVAPAEDTGEMDTAGSDLRTMLVHVGVFKRLAESVDDERDEIDDLMDFCEELRAVVNRKRLAGAEDSVCVKIAQQPLNPIQEIDGHRVFLTVMACTFLTSVGV